MCESKTYKRNYASYRVYAAAVLNARLQGNGFDDKNPNHVEHNFAPPPDIRVLDAMDLADFVARQMCQKEKRWVEEGESE